MQKDPFRYQKGFEAFAHKGFNMRSKDRQFHFRVELLIS